MAGRPISLIRPAVDLLEHPGPARESFGGMDANRGLLDGGGGDGGPAVGLRAPTEPAGDGPRLPGANVLAYLMLPFRVTLVLLIFGLFYPLLLLATVLRAVGLRVFVGKPSQILKLGSRGNDHKADQHYPCQMLFDAPLEEARLRPALLKLCAEDGAFWVVAATRTAAC